MARGWVSPVFLSALMLSATAVPVAAAEGWRFSASGIVGVSLPLEVNDLRISDPSVPLDLRSSGGQNENAPVFGGRLGLFRTGSGRIEWGAIVDLRTFRYDGKAGVRTRLTGTVAGERVDDVEVSAGDETRVTMALAAVVARWPIGRSAERPNGRWAPYAGVGGGNQHARVKAGTTFTTDAPTFQALGGVEFAASRRVGLFAEYRFERLRDQVVEGSTTVDIVLRTNHVAGGVSIHF